MKDPRSILITGASSGIGAALAMHYARPGVHMALNGRNAGRLKAVADTCRDRGASVDAQVLEVTDRAAMEAWIGSVDAVAPLELVVANAGIGMAGRDAPALADNAELTFAVNVSGLFHTVHPALAAMRQRGRGQVAIMSSIAGLLGMPGAVAYAASKAAVRSYGEGLRGAFRRHGVEVNVICPGFVVSRMTERNRFRMPLLMSAERAAAIIASGLARNRGRIAFPWPTYAAVRLLQILPEPLSGWILRRSPSK